MKRKIITIAAIAVCISVIVLWPSILATCHFGYESGETIWEITITKAKVSEREMTIPKSIFGRKVTGIAFISDYRPVYCDRLIMPDSVVRVGASSFLQRVDLGEVEFSENLKEIGEYAFTSCYGLKELRLPESVEVIGENAFSNCGGLEKVEINGDARIGKDAFIDCRRLEELFIAEGVSEIGERAIGGCDKLRRLTIPSTVTDMSWFETSYSEDDVPEGLDVPEELVIITPKGSVAEQYAIEHGIEVRNE